MENFAELLAVRGTGDFSGGDMEALVPGVGGDFLLAASLSRTDPGLGLWLEGGR